MARKKTLNLSPTEATLLPAQPDDVLENDELWSFVGSKQWGEVWLWASLCRRTRQIVAFALGERSDEKCRELYENIPPDYRSCQSRSDFWSSYDKVFPNNTSCGKESGETAHIERWNNTLRQRLSRFVRKTLSFSKTLTNHFLHLAFFIHGYNMEIKESYGS